MKVVVLTTSYPREPDDVAGVFVRDAVEHLRAAGVEVAVVSPASFRHFGIAYGDGIVGNVRRRPWKARSRSVVIGRKSATSSTVPGCVGGSWPQAAWAYSRGIWLLNRERRVYHSDWPSISS